MPLKEQVGPGSDHPRQEEITRLLDKPQEGDVTVMIVDVVTINQVMVVNSESEES